MPRAADQPLAFTWADYRCRRIFSPASGRFLPLGRQDAEILFFLFVHRTRMRAIRDLVDFVWRDDPDGGPLTARNIIRIRLCLLRKRFPSLPIRREAGMIGLL